MEKVKVEFTVQLALPLDTSEQSRPELLAAALRRKGELVALSRALFKERLSARVVLGGCLWESDRLIWNRAVAQTARAIEAASMELEEVNECIRKINAGEI